MCKLCVTVFILVKSQSKSKNTRNECKAKCTIQKQTGTYEESVRLLKQLKESSKSSENSNQ